MRIHSAEYTGPDYREVKLSGLWLSEGFTMYYADLIHRRAGLPVEEATRQAHLRLWMLCFGNSRTAPQARKPSSRLGPKAAR